MLFHTGKLRLLAVATTMLASMSFISAASAAGPTYALVQINQQALFFNLMNKGAQDAAKASGKDLVIFNSNDNPVAQNDAIENYIQQGVKGILVAAIDVNGIMPAVKEAAAANIPVIAIDAVLPAGPQAAQVGVDNIEGGRIIGQYFVDYVQKEMGGQARLGIVGALNSAIQNQWQKGFEETLWDTANQLRGSVESSEYKHVVLSLVFLKFISDKFEARRAALIKDGKEAFVDMDVFYQQDNIFYLPEETRWSFIQAHAKQDDIAVLIDTALSTIEKRNPSLQGALPDNYFSRQNLEVKKLASLIDSIENIDTLADECHLSEEDLVGRVYEYFLGKFAALFPLRVGE